MLSKSSRFLFESPFKSGSPCRSQKMEFFFRYAKHIWTFQLQLANTFETLCVSVLCASSVFWQRKYFKSKNSTCIQKGPSWKRTSKFTFNLSTYWITKKIHYQVFSCVLFIFLWSRFFLLLFHYQFCKHISS